MRVLIAMSGGVDSSVAAAELVAQGHEVIGVTLHLWDYPERGDVRGRCCAPEDLHDARRVADRLGIPHYAFDRRERFSELVVAPFVQGYLDGDTPSPCVHCNRDVKLRELLHLRTRLGAQAVATGHYARIHEVGGVPRLFRGRDHTKDQSYFLFPLPPEALSQLRFPLGELTKAEVRARALSLDLPGATKGESQELCFVPTGRYADFVAARGAGRVRPGPIVDAAGRELGRHSGVHGFTVGQRRNLGVAVGERAYVVAIDGPTGTVRLGSRDELVAARATLTQVTLSDDVGLPRQCEVAVRYRGRPVRATIADHGEGIELSFAEPVHAVVVGQFAVLYEGERVLGGGRITSVRQMETR